MAARKPELLVFIDGKPGREVAADGGPAPADITALFRQESTDWRDDTRRFLDALIFNWAIAGSDAHAKN